MVGGVQRRRGRRDDDIRKIIRHPKQKDVKDVGRVSYFLLSAT